MPASRSLSFRNLHTDESLDVTYWAQGEYIEDALVETDKLLRDYRTNETARIDVGLLNLLHDIRSKLESPEPYHVISGYRSPATNATLAAKSSGVAKRSLHMRGMAVDVRLPGRDLRHLRRAAMAMKRGGVGLYAKSNFVHLDVGRPRYW
jgi:uncharacterized protein YcbK (DUF882 family)